MITPFLIPFVSEVRSLSVSADGMGRCRCARCSPARVRARLVSFDHAKSFSGAGLAGRQLPHPHVLLDSQYIYKEAREKIQPMQKDWKLV